MQIIHDGWRDEDRRVPAVALETLAFAGLFQTRYSGRDKSYFVTPAAFQRYTSLKQAQGQPVERVQRQVRNYIDAEPFREWHPTAFKKWQETEERLWKDDSPCLFTVIGHLCRETMQEFFSASILRHEGIPALELDKSTTVDRIRLFLNARKAKMGRKIAWYIHDQLPYDRMLFHPILCAINLGWSDMPRKIVQSYIKDGGPAFPKRGEPAFSGDHSKEYMDLPPLKRGQDVLVI